MKSILDVLTLSTAYLKDKGIEYPRRQAEDLIADALGLKRLNLYLDFERPLDDKELAVCRERLLRRGKGEPLAYIRGDTAFYGCDLILNSDVLIPRQETEILVDKIVKQLVELDLKNKVLWDVCCGSGCIGISLKKKFPELTVVLSDVSDKALQVAQQNAHRNNVDVELRRGHLLDPFKGEKAHFFVCNPPYISEIEYSTLDREVTQYEPKTALVSGETGLEIYQTLAKTLPSHLFPEAHLWFEIGYRQGEAIMSIFKDQFWKGQRVEKDWAGHDRFFFLENE